MIAINRHDLLHVLAAALLMTVAVAAPAVADQEASNVAHVAAGPYGRCYAKSVPAHVYDPDDDRQAGRTEVYLVGADGDALIETYDWFSQQIFVLCNAGQPERTAVVRVGPWPRGHTPRADHLALAFYAGGRLLERYSTLDIATLGGPRDETVVPSVSHYQVFETPPAIVRRVSNDGGVFRERWVVEARTVAGRDLVFDPATGALLED